MFPLRLVRGYRALDLGRWLITATAAATAAAFLLRSLGRALGEPSATSVPRLLWCLPTLAAVGWLSAAAARAVPVQHPERIAGLAAAGLGPVRIRLLIAVETALAAALGSALALLSFLVLRNDIAGPGLAADVGLGSTLPAAAPITLLVLVPLTAGCAAAAAVPLTDALPGRMAEPRGTGFHPARIAVPTGLTVVGMALELYGLRPGAEQDGRPVDLPAHLGSVGTAALTGWAFTALGLALLTAPLLAFAGRALALRRPGPVRLLAARSLTAEARPLAGPLAVLALGTAVLVAALGYGDDPDLPVRAAVVLLAGCAVGAVVARALEIRAARREVTAALVRLGADARTLRRAVAVRAAAAAAVLLLTGGLTALFAAACLV
ncbi:hypothetical protein BX265_2296 [Streptomyces sp. TLI_235]|nr:hypothetical protein [Streptomyces sp. TLI_235]PBC77545.1 hypothetical protein BX265_2296 [Streptomyces sp. TLI_235]